jgi:hypothetical protein
MSALRVHKRKRNTQPTFEHLDMRITPTAVTAAATLAAELRIEGRHVDRWEAKLAVATPGSHQQQVLTNHIARTEQRMGAQEARLRAAAPSYRIKGQPPSNNPPSPVMQPFSVAAPAQIANLQTSTTSTTTADPPAITTVGNNSGGGSVSGVGTDTGSSSTSTNPLPPNAAVVLDVIYNAYTQNPSDFLADLPSTNGANRVVIQGTNVGIQVSDNNPADFNTLVSQLQAAGMQITTSSAAYGMVVGMLPIAQLPAVAGLSEAPSVTALYQPSLSPSLS